jgi:hypothetical protein
MIIPSIYCRRDWTEDLFLSLAVHSLAGWMRMLDDGAQKQSSLPHINLKKIIKKLLTKMREKGTLEENININLSDGNDDDDDDRVNQPLQTSFESGCSTVQ